jgi:flagellar biosynthesis chaperone FliJ
MSKSNDESTISLAEQLAAIQQQLSQLNTRFQQVENKIEDLSHLSTKISQLEDSLLLVTDRYRYTNLQKYLAEENWFAADKETIQLIIDVMEKDIENLTPEDIQHFPCKDLIVIDRLWRKYSGDRFGFTIQLEIYQQVGGTLETTIEQNQQLVEKWGEVLGWREGDRWRKCSELDYSLDAPKGCHPSRWWNSPYGSKMTNFFLGRLMSCNLT